jgi:hypothetical protein
MAARHSGLTWVQKFDATKTVIAAYYLSPPNARAAGILLAEGRSLRFGSEKTVAQFQDRALMDWVTERFESFPTFAVSAGPFAEARGFATANTPETLATFEPPE